MKKTYSKPEIMFESFAVSTNIAAGCGDMKEYAEFAADACGVTFGNMVLFFDTIAACKNPVSDGYENICYHNPSDDNNLFNS